MSLSQGCPCICNQTELTTRTRIWSYQINPFFFFFSKKWSEGSLCGPFFVADFHSMVSPSVISAKLSQAPCIFTRSYLNPWHSSRSLLSVCCVIVLPRLFSSNQERPDPYRSMALQRIRTLLQHHFRDCTKSRNFGTICSSTLRPIYTLQSIGMGCALVSRQTLEFSRKGHSGGHYFYANRVRMALVALRKLHGQGLQGLNPRVRT